MDPASWPFGSYQPHAGPLISDEELKRFLREALSHESITDSTGSRKDIAKRVEVARECIRGGMSSLPLPQCCDPMITHEEQDPITRLLQRVKPCCCGDGSVDLRRMNAGMAYRGDVDCSICLEALEGGERPLGLPCGHSFHMQCCQQWLSNHDTCPSCRYDLGQPGSEYIEMFESYKERVRVRVREWFISGMCERCQAVFHESNPLVFVPSVRGGEGATVVPRRTVV